MAKKNIEARKGKEAKKPVLIKKKKKNWTRIIASKDFNNVELGETLCETPNELIGKALQVNLMQLTNDPKRQSVKITFKIKEVNGNTAVAAPEKYMLSDSLVKRIVRREGTKLDDSFTAESKDKTKFQIKPLMSSKSKLHRSVAASLRNIIRNHVKGEFLKESDSEILKSVIDNKLQREIKAMTRKTYPLAVCDIRVLEKL